MSINLFGKLFIFLSFPEVSKINFLLYIRKKFLIINNKELYHFGASLKDLGGKWFAVSKMDVDVLNVMEKLK